MHICTHKHVFNVKLSEPGVQMSYRRSKIVDITPGAFLGIVAMHQCIHYPQWVIIHAKECIYALRDMSEMRN
jgi:hypothetical protein